MRLQPTRLLRAFVLLAPLCASLPVHAYQWQDIGTASAASLDKTFVDLESFGQEDGYKTAMLMTVYEKPKRNQKGLELDRNTKKIAFDCTQRKFAVILTTAYREGKPVGVSPPNPAWKENFLDLPPTGFGKRLHEAVCGAAGGNPRPGGPEGILSQPEIPKPEIPKPGAAVLIQPPPKAKPRMSTGSGIAVTRDGYVLTNNHVISGCKKIYVKGLRTQDVEASIAALDPRNDLALVKAPLEFAQVAAFRSPTKPARLGESIGVIGYPLTGLLSSEPKATFGQVNSVAGIANDYTLLQISAPIQGGNSGGPVLDSTGSVVGVVVSQIASSRLAATTGAVPQNVNFAIRGELAQMFMSAHGIKFAEATQRKKLETDEMAELGQQFTAFIICTRE